MVPFFVTLLSVYLFDLASKLAVRASFPIGYDKPLLSFFSLVHVRNTGIAFGLFQQRNPLFIAIGAVVMAGLGFYAVRLYREDRRAGLIVAGILGGALGNLTDRVFFGEVTDFLDFHWGIHHWPAFNVADSAICVGAALLIWNSYKCSQS